MRDEINSIIKLATAAQENLKNGKYLAAIYCNLFDDQQAEFWGFVARDFASCPKPAAACQQNAAIAYHLNNAGADYILNLAEHIKLRREEQSHDNH